MPLLLALVFACFLGIPARAASDSVVLCDDIADPVTLDPHHAFENKSDNIILQMFEGLLRFDSDGKIRPSLATGCLQKDPLTLQCHIRKGVVFHDGEPLNAEAGRWSLSRQLDPATGYPAAMELANIREVRVVDPYLVEIKTGYPDGLLPYRLASFVKILPPLYFSKVGADKFAAAPIGTGPFRFARWEHGKFIELSANENYWEKGVPRIKMLTFRFVPEAQQLELLYQGKLDLVTEIPATKTLEVVRNSETKIQKRLVLTTPAFWFTSFSGPFSDRRVRQALNLAVNKEQLIHYAVLGNGKAIATLSMEGEIGHNAMLKPYSYSPRLAKQLLRSAGYPNGLALTVLVAEQAAREAKIIAADWKKIGVEAQLTILPLREVHLIMAQKRKEYDVSGNLAPNPTAHMYFLPGVCFYSHSLFSRMHSSEFDALYEKVLETIEPSAHSRLAEQLDAWIFREALGVFTYQKIRTYAMRRDLELTIPVTGVLDFKEAHWKH